MVLKTAEALADLYEVDEVAWLEASADLIRRRELSALDLDHLAEFLTDMAKRERREVKSRLVVLLAHLLKWDHQPQRRSRSWHDTVSDQGRELADQASDGVLRAHAEAVLADAYAAAVKKAANETGLPRADFPPDCPYIIERLLNIDLGEADLPGGPDDR